MRKYIIILWSFIIVPTFLLGKNIYFRNSFRIYEFHPRKVIFSNVFILNEKDSYFNMLQHNPHTLKGYNNLFQEMERKEGKNEIISLTPYWAYLPDLYEKDDLLNVICCDNIKNFTTIWDSVIWRNEKFYFLKVNWVPNTVVPLSSESLFWVKCILKRLPHLHTHDYLTPGRIFDFGLSFSKDYIAISSYMILAFPKDTKIIATSGLKSEWRLMIDNWIVLAYGIPENRRVSAHVKFILPEKDQPDIELNQFLRNILGVVKNIEKESN